MQFIKDEPVFRFRLIRHGITRQRFHAPDIFCFWHMATSLWPPGFSWLRMGSPYQVYEGNVFPLYLILTITAITIRLFFLKNAGLLFTG